MTEIRSLSSTSFDDLYIAFNAAFADYEFQWTKADLERMLLRRGYDAELSFGAFVNDKLVSFTLNGIGKFNNQKTAYDSGTATIKEYRGQGFATQVFEHSIPFLKECEISQYVLEVLHHNTKAVSVYTKIGFETSRHFNHFVQDTDKVNFLSHALPDDLQLRFIYLSDKDAMMSLWDFKPAWQNTFDSLTRQMGGFMMLGVFDNEKLVGYGAIETITGDIPQLAVHKDYRRRGIGSVIFKELFKYNDSKIVKIVNMDASNTAVPSFLERHNIPLKGKQFEMIKAL